MKWAAFKKEASEIASSAEMLIEKSGVILLGTIRKDGSPRISPVEPFIVDGELQLGMMPRSLKALDLRRDPRCTIHSAVSDRMARDGEFKLHGHAVEVRDPEKRRRYEKALLENIGWSPEGMDYPLYSIEIASAAFFVNLDDERIVKRWRAGERPQEFRQGIEGGEEPNQRAPGQERLDG